MRLCPGGGVEFERRERGAPPANCSPARTVTPSAIGRFACQRHPPGFPRVACTIPVALARGSARGLRETTGQTALSYNRNSWPHTTAGAIGCHLPEPWFVTVDEGTLAAARIGPTRLDRVYSVRIGVDWTRELKRLQTFGRLASVSPDEGQVFVDAHAAAWRAVAGAAAPGSSMRWKRRPGS